jgi:hypothetical protein
MPKKTPPSNAITIVEYQNKDTIAVCREIIEKAERGEVTGMLFALRLTDFEHGIGATGTYRDDPVSGLTAAGRLLNILSKLASKMVKPGKL